VKLPPDFVQAGLDTLRIDAACVVRRQVDGVGQMSGPTGTVTSAAKSFRHEVYELFGVRWETAIEWVVITYLSTWFWWSILASRGSVPGPLTWGADAIHSAGFGTQHWLVDTATWLVSPDRTWVYTVLVIAVAMAATASIGQRTGFRVVALVALTLALEINPTLVTAKWVLLGVSVLAAMAVVLSVVSDEAPRRVFAVFISEVLILPAAPVFAPVVVLFMLATRYDTATLYEPSLLLAASVDEAIRTAEKASTEVPPICLTMALVAAITSANDPRAARKVAARFHSMMESRLQKVRDEATATRRREEFQERMRQIRAPRPFVQPETE